MIVEYKLSGIPKGTEYQGVWISADFMTYCVQNTESLTVPVSVVKLHRNIY